MLAGREGSGTEEVVFSCILDDKDEEDVDDAKVSPE